MVARDTINIWRLLAFAALVMQLALSAGHFHSDYNATATTAVSACSLTEAPVCPPLHHDDEGGDCEICKALRLAFALVLPAPPAIPRTVEVDNTFCARRSVEVVATLGAHAFQARGPPAS